jgi:hypothetical protein
MEFTPNSYSSKCPRTPIYSLRVRMSVRHNLPRSRPDGGPWTSGQTTVRQDILGISAEKSFLYKNIVRKGWLDFSDGRTSAASYFHIRLRTSGPWAGASGRLNFSTQFPYTMCVSPEHEEQTSGRLKSNHQLP